MNVLEIMIIANILLVLLNIWILLKLVGGLSQQIDAQILELVEELPPALENAIGGGMEGLAGGLDVNPIQMAIAQIIPDLLKPPTIEAKMMERDEKGQFSAKELS